MMISILVFSSSRSRNSTPYAVHRARPFSTSFATRRMSNKLSDALRRCLRADRAYAVADAQPHPVADGGAAPVHTSIGGFRFLVAWPPSGDLCIHAKHLLSCANPNHISGPLGRRRDAGSEPSPTGRDGHCRPLRRRYGKNGGKAPAIDDRGKLAERIEVEFGPFRPAASRRAECLLVALPTSWGLLLCAKHLFVAAVVAWQKAIKLCGRRARKLIWRRT